MTPAARSAADEQGRFSFVAFVALVIFVTAPSARSGGRPSNESYRITLTMFEKSSVHSGVSG
jgi:hypothetical protein